MLLQAPPGQDGGMETSLTENWHCGETRLRRRSKKSLALRNQCLSSATLRSAPKALGAFGITAHEGEIATTHQRLALCQNAVDPFAQGRIDPFTSGNLTRYWIEQYCREFAAACAIVFSVICAQLERVSLALKPR